jgi:hypothetical protein
VADQNPVTHSCLQSYRRFPGAAQHGAQRSGALQTRDRYERRVCDDPGSAVHRCALHRIRETSAMTAKANFYSCLIDHFVAGK